MSYNVGLGIFTDGFTPSLGIMPRIVFRPGLADAAYEVSAVTTPVSNILMGIPTPVTEIAGAVLKIVPGIVSAFEKDPYERQVFPICQQLARIHGVTAVAEWFGTFQGSDPAGQPVSLGTIPESGDIVTNTQNNSIFMQAAANATGQSFILLGSEDGSVWQQFDPQTSTAGAVGGLASSPVLLIGLALGALLLFK
jgi:hypothetical protein